MAVLVSVPSPPCILHEDEHILIANKPAGLNTHSPSPYAGEGLYDWLRNREPRWSNLAIIHRLDKSTSGLIVFAKSRLANQSLTQQFTERRVHKRYVLLSSVKPPDKEFSVRIGIARAGERYLASDRGESAETNFSHLGLESGYHLLAAEPLTGRTHQIRVHAAHESFPILGDSTYGGAPFQRVCLHAAELSFTHPASNDRVTFRSKPDFFRPVSSVLRAALIEPSLTNAFRAIHGAADDHPDLYLDQWGEQFLAQSPHPPEQISNLDKIPLLDSAADRPFYFKRLSRTVSRSSRAEAQPQHLSGKAAPEPFTVRENGANYEISFRQGYSVGLFLDQRDNRRRVLTNYVAPNFHLFENGLAHPEVLNTFSYTCAFSVCAAIAGARTTSLDLSRKYLEWGKRNFVLNQLDPSTHDFIYGDVFDWAPRLVKKNRTFDLILLDPPTFSRSKSGDFKAERDYGKLVRATLPLLRPGGVLFASTNAAKLSPDDFIAQSQEAVSAAKRRILAQQYIPQPPDFPITRDEPAYLKTIWFRIS